MFPVQRFVELELFELLGGHRIIRGGLPPGQMVEQVRRIDNDRASRRRSGCPA